MVLNKNNLWCCYTIVCLSVLICSCSDNSTEVQNWENAIRLEPNTQIQKLRLDELFEIDKLIALETSSNYQNSINL
jgi:Tfp pilus assembly protein PilP